MISPDYAMAFIIGFLIIFGIVIPILNVKIPKYVSFRWLCVICILAILIGAVVDFNGLGEDSRRIILIGGLAICGGFVVLRTLEKILANGWLKGASIEAKKGDASVILKSDNNNKE